MAAKVRIVRTGRPNVEAAGSRWCWLYKVSGVAALLAGTFLLIAVIDMILTGLQPSTINAVFSRFQNNWLVVIFKLHAGFNDIQQDRLYVLNLLDSVILVLVGAMGLGLYAALRKTSQIWAFAAMAQPWLGLMIFIATRNAGRSAVMGAGLVASIVMLRSNIFNKVAASIGILASVFLLVGDFSVMSAPSAIMAVITGSGYVLMMTWLFLISQRLFQLGQGN